MGIIYKIKCTKTGRSYIGQSKNIKRRFDDHKYKLRHNQHYSKEMQDDFNLFGEAEFQFSILEEVSDNILDERESYWISSSDNVYNIESGGVRDKQLADSTKEKLSAKAKVRYKTHAKYFNNPTAIKKRSISNTGKKRDDDFRKKMSDIAKKRIGPKNSFFGKKHSEETKRKISEANKGKYDGGKPKIPIVAIHLETGETREYASKSDASKDIFPARSFIDKVLNGEKKHYKGYTFKELKHDDTEVN